MFKYLIKQISRDDQFRHAELLQGTVSLVIIHELCDRRAVTAYRAGRVSRVPELSESRIEGVIHKVFPHERLAFA